MKVLSIHFLKLVSLLLLTLTVSCGGGGGATPPTTPIASIVVEPGSVAIAQGASQKFSATARDAAGNPLSGVSFTWSSSNAGVAQIDSNGMAQGQTEGTVTISASSNGVSGTAPLQVKTITTVELSPAIVTIAKNSTLQFSAVARAGDGTALSGVTFTWSSDHPNIASIDSNALASGIAEGTAIISASAGLISGTTTVQVTFRLFSDPTTYPAGNTPSAVAFGDFNHDGLTDLATANTDGGTLTLLMGIGNGLLGTAQTFTTGVSPESLVAGRFNGDTFDDLAVANYGNPPEIPSGIPSSISIFLGTGSGIGSVAGIPMSDSGPLSIVTADFNHDGKLDLATANLFSGQFSVMLGNGDGSFNLPVSFLAGGNGPIALAAADFNGDTQADLAVVLGADGKIAIFLGNGDGTFSPSDQDPPVTIPVGTGLHPNPSGITSGDWDGDGKIDLAVVNSGSHSLTLLFGDGTGAFPAVQSASLPEGGSPRYVVTGDFNGDTYPDLAVSNRDNHTVSILLNNHDGTFSAPIVRSVGQGPLAMAVGRLNGDNLDDLAVVNSRDNTISVFLQFP